MKAIGQGDVLTHMRDEIALHALCKKYGVAHRGLIMQAHKLTMREGIRSLKANELWREECHSYLAPDTLALSKLLFSGFSSVFSPRWSNCPIVLAASSASGLLTEAV